jgi:acyl-CoA thioester hydrolase
VNAGDKAAYALKKRVQFHDTDLMGVVHHANYLKYFEEARVDWLRWAGLEATHFPHCDRLLAVVSSGVEHLSPCRFGEELEINLQVRLQRLKIEFQYVIYNRSTGKPAAKGFTLHVLVDGAFKPQRPERRFKEFVENQKWTETLP